MQSKHTFLLAFLLTFLSLPTILFAQTTEGTDFWVTFMQADQDNNNSLKQTLSISSRYDCQVTISNPFTSYSETVSITADQLKQVDMYSGSVLKTDARTAQNTTGKVCYAVNSEMVDTCAIHVVATKPISLFASSYKKATFDATNVLPTASLQDSYVIQTYSPTDHGMSGSSQGSHFAIIATEDNTVVEYTPTVLTEAARSFQSEYNTWGDDLFNVRPEYRRYQGYSLGQTMLTDTLMAGQVYYVWTGLAEKKAGDLSGTVVKAKDGKKIAVFQGCPHTNIPDNTKERDHIFSQAMPTQTWGNTFAITASNGRKRDIFRIMALNDQTVVYIDGTAVHTFDFENGTEDDKKHYWEFELGEASIANHRSGVPVAAGVSHMVTTSCPCALHEFLTSKKYDDVANGDPAMLWINPIEQQIDQVTFATYSSSNGTTIHNVNIVTEHPEAITLDGASIASEFSLVTGSTRYYFARHSLGNAAASHTLKATQGGFIAHVYGFTENESYGYSAGGNVATLTQSIMINGVEFTPEAENTLCGIDTIHFVCDLDYTFSSITWDFGDGSPAATGTKVDHFYAHTGDYPAKCTILRESSNLCQGELAEYVIPINVHIGKLEFRVDSTVNHICENRQLEMYYTNTGTAFTADNCVITFNDKASAFPPVQLKNGYFLLTVPTGAEEGDGYSFKLEISTGCGDTSAVVNFAVPFDASKLIRQRYNSIFVVDTAALNAKSVLSYQWYENGTAMPEQTSGVLNLEGASADALYKVRVTYINAAGETIEQETCGLSFDLTNNPGLPQLGDTKSTSAVSGQAGDQLFFCTTAEGEASLYNIHGQLVNTYSLTNEGGLIDLPTDKGVYVLRIKTANEKAALKVYVY